MLLSTATPEAFLPSLSVFLPFKGSWKSKGLCSLNSSSLSPHAHLQNKTAHFMVIHTDSVEFPAPCPRNPSVSNFPFFGSVPPVTSSLKTLWIRHRVLPLAPQGVTVALLWGEETWAGTFMWQLNWSGDSQRPLLISLPMPQGQGHRLLARTHLPQNALSPITSMTLFQDHWEPPNNVKWVCIICIHEILMS